MIPQSLSWNPLSDTFSVFTGSGIYLIRRIGGTSVYVGSSRNIRRRLREHYNALKKGTHVNKKLTDCFKSYGPFGMEFALPEQCSGADLMQRETYWITLLNSYAKGLNCTGSASGAGTIPSAETRLKIGAKSLGRRHSAESRLLISIASKNQSATSRAAAGSKKLGKKRSPEAIAACVRWHTGKKRSDATRFNISKAVSKIKAGDVPMILEMIKKGFTYVEIAKKLKVSKQTICNVRNRKNICLNVCFENIPVLASNTSDRTKERRSAAQRGRKASKATKAKLSLARKGVQKSNSHREAISAALKRHYAAKRDATASL